MSLPARSNQSGYGRKGVSRQPDISAPTKRGTLPGKQRRTAKPVVTTLPKRNLPPAWLRSLLIAYRGSLAMTFLVVGAALMAYGWTVYAQKLWSQEYRKLETLQRTERELIAANEAFKNHIARQAERSDSGLVVRGAENTIFLQPAPPRRAPAQPAAQKSASAPKPPLGY